MYERAARFAAPAAVAALLVVGTFFETPSTESVIAAAIAVLLCLALAVRPLGGWLLVIALAILVALTAVTCDGLSGNLGWFSVCVLAVWAGGALPVARAASFAAGAAGLFVLEWLVLTPDEGWGAWIFGTAISGVAGIAGRRQRELVAQLREAQAGLADRARAEERNRIAHELHDVIGHALTVSLLHVTSARLALDEDPVEAGASLAEAERLARQSLAEVRAVVGLMHDADSPAPLPGAGQLDGLVESFRRAGTDVRWSVDGELDELTAAEGLVVYRIVQEALTNVARHAPRAQVVASVSCGAQGTRVVVDSGGAPPRVVHEGTGLLGMRQRAEAVGGRLVAGPGGTGWRVEAVLP